MAEPFTEADLALFAEDGSFGRWLATLGELRFALDNSRARAEWAIEKKEAAEAERERLREALDRMVSERDDLRRELREMRKDLVAWERLYASTETSE